MKVVYIAGPYRGPRPIDVKRNIRLAERIAEGIWKTGNIPICPHTNSAFIDGLVEDRLILEGYLEVLSRCDVVVMIGNWKISVGAMAEYNLALELGKEVIEWGTSVSSVLR